jgi:hypothetical protein
MISQLIEELKTAKTTREMAQATVQLLRACGIYNHQALVHELARMCVTDERE